MKSTFSRSSMNEQRASSKTIILFTDGRAKKSKVARDLVLGNFAAFVRRSADLRSLTTFADVGEQEEESREFERAVLVECGTK